MKILPEQMRLYAVTDRTWLHGRNLIDVVSEAIDGGATFVQLREKNHLEGMELSGEELLAEAKKLAQLCHERGVLFVIDDDGAGSWRGWRPCGSGRYGSKEGQGASGTG